VISRRLVLASLLALLCRSASAEIYTIFSDEGFPPSTASSNVDAYGNYSAFDPNSTDLAPPEGAQSFKMTLADNTFAGWTFDYGSLQDLSRFQVGELRFWIYSTTPNIEIDVKNNNDPGNPTDSANYVIRIPLQSAPYNLGSSLNQWTLIRIPLSSPLHTLSNVEFPFVATASGSPGTFYVDDVRYVDTTTSPIFNVAVLNNTTNLSDTFSWNAASPAGWSVANQHIQLTLDPNVVSWGVQIYTDNTASDANPKWAGPAGTNPAGLVDTTLGTRAVPLAWSIKDSSITAPSAADPNNTGDLNSYQWLFMKDKATPNIPATNTTAFFNGDPYMEVKSNQGIHFGGAPTEFGADNPPNNIFLEANFTSAITPLTYSTNKITVEYYTP